MREEDFPALDGDRVYLDSACMSLRPRQVIEKVREYYTDYPACSGRSHHGMSKRASEELEAARQRVAGFIGASEDDLVFTSGTTESINTVSSGFPFERVFTTDREHNSNLVPWQRTGRENVVLDTGNGLDLSTLDSRLEEGDLVSVIHVSNLDGFEVPVEEVLEVAEQNGAYSLVDAAQSVPHRPFTVDRFDADFVAFSGHKMLGPSGTGALYVSDRAREKIEPLKVGGGAVRDSTYTGAEYMEFPQRMEAGLPNLAGFIGFGEAARYLEEVGLERVESHEKELTCELEQGLEDIEKVEVVSNGTGIVSFRVENMDSHQVALMLSRENIAVRSGMHCVHSWFQKYSQEPLVRASTYLYNNSSDIESLVEAVRDIAYLA